MWDRRSSIYIIWEERQALKEQLYVLLYDTDWVMKIVKLDELQQLGADICLVLPASSCTIHKLHLPKVNTKDLPLAVAAMLEDKILGNFADFFTYIDKLTAEDYLAYLWERQYLATIQAFFEKHQIRYTAVTLDWFALKPQEVFLMADGAAFVYSDEVQGYLNKSVFKHWFQHYSFDAMSMFAAEAYPEYVGVQAVNTSFWVWMAKRLSDMPVKDIYAKPKRFEITAWIAPKRLWAYFPKLFWGSMLAILLVFIMVYASNFVRINDNQAKLQAMVALTDDDIELHLNRYFNKQQQKNQFWSCWTALQAAKNNRISIDNIQYQQAKMKLNLTLPDMQTYRQFKKRLSHVRIINSQLQSNADGIHLMLEIGAGYV